MVVAAIVAAAVLVNSHGSTIHSSLDVVTYTPALFLESLQDF